MVKFIETKSKFWSKNWSNSQKLKVKIQLKKQQIYKN